MTVDEAPTPEETEWMRANDWPWGVAMLRRRLDPPGAPGVLVNDLLERDGPWVDPDSM